MNISRVLLVDDDENLVHTFQLILQKQGYLVEVATTGNDALAKAKKDGFDLILLDIKLPDILGYEVASKIRGRNKTVAIVLITGFPSFQDAIDALDLGIYEILLKPVSPVELLRVAKEAILFK